MAPGRTVVKELWYRHTDRDLLPLGQGHLSMDL